MPLPSLVHAIEEARLISHAAGRKTITFEDDETAITRFCAPTAAAWAIAPAPRRRPGRIPRIGAPVAPPLQPPCDALADTPQPIRSRAPEAPDRANNLPLIDPLSARRADLETEQL